MGNALGNALLHSYMLLKTVALNHGDATVMTVNDMVMILNHGDAHLSLGVQESKISHAL